MYFDDIEGMKKDRKQGKATDKELLDFALMLLDHQISVDNIEALNKTAEGISVLSMNKDIGSLRRIAISAMEKYASIIEEKGLNETALFKVDVLKKGKKELLSLLNEEAIKKYFPSTL